MKQALCLVLIFIWLIPLNAQGHTSTPDEIGTMIERYKQDPRGPYRDIRWFCTDGSTVAPKERCPQPGGVQRARYKEEVIALGDKQHIFLGQILSTTPSDAFWDASHGHSRIKQYQLEQYLRAIDDGWILRKAKNYRGAVQAEDEEAWGIDFYTWLLANDTVLYRQYYLIRQSLNDIPHAGDDDRSREVRALSKVIAEKEPRFEDLRVKDHGRPQQTDIASVEQFRSKYASSLPPDLSNQIARLIGEMQKMFAPIALGDLRDDLGKIPVDHPVYQTIDTFIRDYAGSKDRKSLAMATAELLYYIRLQLPSAETAAARLALLDISRALEASYLQQSSDWEATTIGELMDQVCHAGLVAVGTGLIELWEWEAIGGQLDRGNAAYATIEQLQFYLDRSRALVEWGAGTIRGVYQPVLQAYGTFEEEAFGYHDHLIRSSVLLPLGRIVGAFGDLIAREANLRNDVPLTNNAASIRGLNPGYAKGKLVVVSGDEEETIVEKNNIYIFQRPPHDLKPVAGIATATEGNVVSHVQLLARNLGIPNAVISAENLRDFARFDGQEIFYAVSPRGTVIMKPATEMTGTESALFAVVERPDEKVRVPVEKMDLTGTSVLNLRDVNATASGRICGPKAANLGQLKELFPERVVEGIVVPFSIFRSHMDRQMPGQQESYWDFLNGAFLQAAGMQKNNATEEAVEAYLLDQLAELRLAIMKMDLDPEFVNDLSLQFTAILGKNLGDIPVFLRSDTNMEDLKDFTGAGLNLTLFNVLSKERILQGIKDVWASPYTERSFKWRQRFLLNPENVFPSILIIPSVNVDKSGVMITKGLVNGEDRDVTIAFNRGVGGAVDGQSAETYLLSHTGYDLLMTPAREPSKRTLPYAGGVASAPVAFNMPVLNVVNLRDLRKLDKELRKKLPGSPGIETSGPFDVELGFLNDQMWLFQVRPFVENKRAQNSEYLESITPVLTSEKKIFLTQSI